MATWNYIWLRIETSLLFKIDTRYWTLYMEWVSLSQFLSKWPVNCDDIPDIDREKLQVDRLEGHE